MENRKKILSFDNLEIGFISKGVSKRIMPPLKASASAGELIALIGHNGVGKSTLLRTITGLQTPLGGNIFINEKEINEYDRTDLAKHIGYISTETIKVGNMNVYDLVALGRFPHTNWMGKIDEADHLIIMDSVIKVGMIDFIDKYIAELSDGERQRAMIARVLAQDTGLLVMDEPTAFLDLRNKFEVVHLMHSLTRERGKTVIFSTHDLQTAINEADKIWLALDSGIVEGSPEDLIINGSFNSIFDDSALTFNNTDGTFVIDKGERKSICLEGEGLQKLWTEKALNRIGYNATEGITGNRICIVTEGNVTEWKLTINGKSIDFKSIYELVRWLERAVS